MKNVIGDILTRLDSTAIHNSHPDVGGMTTAKVRWFLNQLVAELPPEDGYFEVGVHMGGTLIPALSGHLGVDATACDNWSDFVNVGGRRSRDIFFENLERYKESLPKIRVVEEDVWEFLKKPDFVKPIGILFYDGGHTEADQRRIINDIQPYLAKEAVLVIDDYDHPPTKAGTELGMKDVAWTSSEFFYRSGPSGFHNGLGVFYVVKQ